MIRRACGRARHEPRARGTPRTGSELCERAKRGTTGLAALAAAALAAGAHAADPPGATRSAEEPWVVHCRQPSCVSRELAAESLLHQRSAAPSLTDRPFGMSLRDAQKFSVFGERWAAARAAQQAIEHAKFCERSEEIATYPELAAAFAARDAAADEFVNRYLREIRRTLSRDGAARVDAAIERQRVRLGGWTGFDPALRAELEGIAPARYLERFCEKPRDTVPAPPGTPRA